MEEDFSSVGRENDQSGLLLFLYFYPMKQHFTITEALISKIFMPLIRFLPEKFITSVIFWVGIRGNYVIGWHSVYGHPTGETLKINF